jgi:hypothetical protein
MSRTLDPDFQALIDTGHFERHTAVVITLGDDDETVLRFARSETPVGVDVFLALLGESDPLRMSLQGQATDRQGLKAQNLDGILGQQLTGISNALEGATAVLGVIFQDQDHLGPIFYDEKMPGDIVAGAVDRQWAELNFVGDLYGGQIVGVTVGAAFPYQQTVAPAQVLLDPNDLRDLGGGGGGDIGDRLRDHLGRLPMTDFIP